MTGPTVTRSAAAIDTAFATPVISFNYGGNYAFPLPRNESVTGYVLQLTWTAATPASESLDLWIRHVGDFSVPPADPTSLPNTVQDNQPTLKATGGSPLRLAFRVDTLGADMDYEILVRAAGPVGVATQQPVTLDMAVFDGLAYDEAFEFTAA